MFFAAVFFVYPVFVTIIALWISTNTRKNDTPFKGYTFRWLGTSFIPPLLIIATYVLFAGLQFHGVCPRLAPPPFGDSWKEPTCGVFDYILFSAVTSFMLTFVPLGITFLITQIIFGWNWFFRKRTDL